MWYLCSFWNLKGVKAVWKECSSKVCLFTTLGDVAHKGTFLKVEIYFIDGICCRVIDGICCRVLCIWLTLHTNSHQNALNCKFVQSIRKWNTYGSHSFSKTEPVRYTTISGKDNFGNLDFYQSLMKAAVVWRYYLPLLNDWNPELGNICCSAFF